MNKSLYTAKEVNKCGRKEIFTEELLSDISKSCGCDFVRKIDNHYSEILLDCGHIKRILNRYLYKKHITPCKTCYERSVVQLFNEYNLQYLSKIKYGSAKSSHEFRLCACKSCGYFLMVQPNRLSTKPKYCSNCYRLKVENICIEKGCNLVNKVDKDHVEVSCLNCGNHNILQLTNLYNSNFNCKYCEYKPQAFSYVYLFEIVYKDFNVLKFGKSNCPYLRSFNFPHSEDTQVKFICSTKTRTEDEAFELERYMKMKFKYFNIDRECGRKIVKDGFTELYDILAYDEIVRTIEGYTYE